MTWLVFAIQSVNALLLKPVSDEFYSDRVYIFGINLKAAKEKSEGFVVIPCVKGLSESVARVIKTGGPRDTTLTRADRASATLILLHPELALRTFKVPINII